MLSISQKFSGKNILQKKCILYRCSIMLILIVSCIKILIELYSKYFIERVKINLNTNLFTAYRNVMIYIYTTENTIYNSKDHIDLLAAIQISLWVKIISHSYIYVYAYYCI